MSFALRRTAQVCGKFATLVSSAYLLHAQAYGPLLQRPFTNSAGQSLYFGQVATSAPGAGYSIAVGDLNGDGIADVVAAVTNGGSSSYEVLIGKKDGTFAVPVLLALPTGCGLLTSPVIGDVNGDGKPDIVAFSTCSRTANISTFPGKGDGTFGPRSDSSLPNTALYGAELALADLNGDHILDVVLAAGSNVAAPSVRILLGKGDRTFAQKAQYSLPDVPQSHVTIADFNGDHKLDLAVNSQGGSFSVLLGNGDGTFQQAINTQIGRAGADAEYAVADLNRDGKLDVAAMAGTFGQPGSINVYLGTGDGRFQLGANLPTQWVDNSNESIVFSIAAGDFDGDGRIDLVACVDNLIALWLGDGTGHFTPGGAWGNASETSPLIAADFDGDGRLDLIGSSQGVIYAFLRVTSPPPQVTNTYLQQGSVGSPWNNQIWATNNPLSYGALGMPPGLTVNTATGAISGVPSAAGIFPVTLSASNAVGLGSVVLNLTIVAAGQPPAVRPSTDFTQSLSGYLSAQVPQLTTDSLSGNPLAYPNFSMVLSGIISTAEALQDDGDAQTLMKYVDNVISTAASVTDPGASRSHLAWTQGLPKPGDAAVDANVESSIYLTVGQIARTAAVLSMVPKWASQYAGKIQTYVQTADDMVIQRFYVDRYNSTVPWLSQSPWTSVRDGWVLLRRNST